MTNLRQALQATATGKLIRNEPDSGFQNFCPTANFIGFNGHFPDYPVLPAMLQVLLGIIVSEELSGTRLTLQKLDKAKFMAQIQPEQTITVSCRLTRPSTNESQTTIKARITIANEEQKAASMTLFLHQV